MADSDRWVLRDLIEDSETYSEFRGTLEGRPELLKEKSILFDQVKQRMIAETEYSVDSSDEAIWNRAKELLKEGTAFRLELNGTGPELSTAVGQFVTFSKQHPYVQFDSGITKPTMDSGTVVVGNITGRYVNLIMFTNAIHDMEEEYPNLSFKLQFHT